MTLHNLPPQPYKRFFGRQDSIKKIEEILIEGNTFIASIDGIGGIGKTALAYYFCDQKVVPSGEFDYLVWITAKETVFDPFSREQMIKDLKNDFKGINTLIDTTLAVIRLEDLLDRPLEEKKDFFEKEIVQSEPIFFVLDNLESVEDNEFFEYISKEFNKLAAKNRKLKVLTTSRKRKKIVDFPIEIEGLSTEDSLLMLKYLAREYGIKDILNASDYINIKLIEKVGKIPLGIEFIIGQMNLGKSRGEIISELEGYPSLDEKLSHSEKRKRLSDIILFSFKNMFESLTRNQQHLFKVIVALEKNKAKHDPDITLELLMSITGYSKYQIEDSLEVLLDNKLIEFDENKYHTSQMAISFVRQFYDDFEEIEDQVIGKKNIILQDISKPKDRIDILISNVKPLIENNHYEEAEEALVKALDVAFDYRIYYELAKIQRILNKYSKAYDNYRMACELNPKNSKIWYDWINMEDNRGRYNIAFQIIRNALSATSNEVSIVLLKLNIYKFKKEFQKLRTEIKFFLNFYRENKRINDYLKLLRYWKTVEHQLIKEGRESKYMEVADLLIEVESEPEIKLQILREQLKIAKRIRHPKEKSIKVKITSIENSILRSINSRIKQLNKLFNAKRYEDAKKEARKILNWICDNDE